MRQQRRLWIEAMVSLLEEVVEIHQRVHIVFGHKLNRPHAFPLFQGKRRSRTIIYNAEYDEAGKLQRGVFFITTGAVAQPIASEQWWVGYGRGHWRLTSRSLGRLARRIHNAVADEWNLDLAPLKMPSKLVDWIDGLATEYAQRSRLDPSHPQFAKNLQRVFSPVGREAGGEGYCLPREGLGGIVVAYTLAAACHHVQRGWVQAYATARIGAAARPRPPELWVNLNPGAVEGAVLGFPPPEPDRPAISGGIQLARFPRADAAATADRALRAVVELSSGALYEVAASFAEPKNPARLASWVDTLHAIDEAGRTGAEIWNLTQPRVLESARQAIKAWDKSFAAWISNLQPVT
jgi:hypothetical protein